MLTMHMKWARSEIDQL